MPALHHQGKVACEGPGNNRTASTLMSFRSSIGFGLGVLALGGAIQAAQLVPIDLAPFKGRSHLEFSEGRWALPLGEHVMGGIPWKVDDMIELFGHGPARFGRFARTNVTGIPVGAEFEQLHILGGTSAASNEGEVFAALILDYADGTNVEFPIQYGHQFRDWYGPRHGAEEPMRDPATRVVWRSEIAYSSQYDRGLRLYHWFVNNPHPARTVASISFRSKRASSGLLVLGATYGMTDSPRLTDTLTVPPYLEPGIKTRSGTVVPVRGVVRDLAGTPLTNAFVSVTGLRTPGSSINATGAENPAQGERQTTDGLGRFAFNRTTDRFNYDLVAVVEGHEPGSYLGADPLRGEIEIRLKPATRPAGGVQFVRGRLVDEEGRPVVGARVEPLSVALGSRNNWGGSQGFPSMVVTDPAGEFQFHRAAPFDFLEMLVYAPGLATQQFWLPVSNVVQTVKLGRGAFIAGRLVKDGQPLAGVEVGVSGQGHYRATTDEGGRFLFRELPPHGSWRFYGLTGSLQGQGAVPPLQATTRQHGGTNELGDLTVKPAFRLAGRVVPATGHEPPAEPLTLVLNLMGVSDNQSVQTGPDGSFAFEGLYQSVVGLRLNSGAWRMTTRNRSLDSYGAREMIGFLPATVTNLLIEIEPGQRSTQRRMPMQGSLPPQDAPENRTLSGVEHGGGHLHIAGTVVDDANGTLISSFDLTPGRQPPITARPPRPFLQRVLDTFRDPAIPWNELPWWYGGRDQSVTNGRFQLEFERLTSEPLILIAAPGYEPVVVGPLNTSTNGLVVRLSRASGPAGVVLLPDGNPAVGAKLVYAASREQFVLNEAGDLAGSENEEVLRRTDGAGAFSFQQRLEGQQLLISHAGGWSVVESPDLGPRLKINLEPWAVVRGSLVDTNGAPVPKADLRLSFDGNGPGKGLRLGLDILTTTDSQGQFTFTKVPPADLLLHRMVIQGGLAGGPLRNWSPVLQTRFYASPGVTNDLGQVTLDTPPPEPLLKRLKQKVGL